MMWLEKWHQDVHLYLDADSYDPGELIPALTARGLF